MLTSTQLGAATRDLAEFTWVCFDSLDDAIEVARAAAVLVEMDTRGPTTAGRRVGIRIPRSTPPRRLCT